MFGRLAVTKHTTQTIRAARKGCSFFVRRGGAGVSKTAALACREQRPSPYATVCRGQRAKSRCLPRGFPLSGPLPRLTLRVLEGAPDSGGFHISLPPQTARRRAAALPKLLLGSPGIATASASTRSTTAPSRFRPRPRRPLVIAQTATISATPAAPFAVRHRRTVPRCATGHNAQRAAVSRPPGNFQ